MAEKLDKVHDKVLNLWFPNLDSESYIIPVQHFDYIHTYPGIIADRRIEVLNDKKGSADKTTREIDKHDETHKKVHKVFTKLMYSKSRKNNTEKTDVTDENEVMVIMSQVRFEMYSFDVDSGNVNIGKDHQRSSEDIEKVKQKYSDIIIVCKQRGVLLAVSLSVSVTVPCAARENLEKSVTHLKKYADIVKNMPEADNVAVHTTLVLPNITRNQLENLKESFKPSLCNVPCLCKDEMVTEESLERWWQTCWSSGHCGVMEDSVYGKLVAMFARPAVNVQIHLTTQPHAQLRHKHDVVNTVGDIYGASISEANLQPLFLFPSQEKLLHFEELDEKRDDVRFLWGPPGTGKTILLELRALQWVQHFGARHIFILQTREDGTAASCLVEYQLQQTLNAQQQRAQQSSTDIQSAQCTFTHIDMSGLWGYKRNKAAYRCEDVLEEGWKEKLYTALDLQQHVQSDTAIHILADEADGDIIGAIYQWLKDKGVTIVRLWAAGVEAFSDTKNIPYSLQQVVFQVREPLRCPGPVVAKAMKTLQIEQGIVPEYDLRKQVTEGHPVVHLIHKLDSDGHTSDTKQWRCTKCAMDIVALLKSFHVGEVIEGHQGLSANDVLILGSNMECDAPDDDVRSPAPLIQVLKENKFNVCTLGHTTAKDTFMKAIMGNHEPPTVTVATAACAVGLERKIIIYLEGGLSKERLKAYASATSLLIFGEIIIHELDIAVHPQSPDDSPSSLSSSSKEVHDSLLHSLQKNINISDKNLLAAYSATQMTQTDENPSKRLIPKPSFCEEWQVYATFTSAGGSLCKPRSDVVLTVPPGAVEKGVYRDVYMSVCTDIPHIHKLLGLTDVYIASPLVELWIEGDTKFDKPVQICLPHCLTLSDELRDAQIYHVTKTASGKTTLQLLEAQKHNNFDLPHFISHGNTFRVNTQSFCAYVCVRCNHVNYEADKICIVGCGTNYTQLGDSCAGSVSAAVWDMRLYVKDFQPENAVLPVYDWKLNVTSNESRPQLALKLILPKESTWKHLVYENEAEPNEEKIDLSSILQCSRQSCCDDKCQSKIQQSPPWQLTGSSMLRCLILVSYLPDGEHSASGVGAPTAKPLRVPLDVRNVIPSKTKKPEAYTILTNKVDVTGPNAIVKIGESNNVTIAENISVFGETTFQPANSNNDSQVPPGNPELPPPTPVSKPDESTDQSTQTGTAQRLQH